MRLGSGQAVDPVFLYHYHIWSLAGITNSPAASWYAPGPF